MTGIRLCVLVWVPLLLSADAVKGPHYRRSAQGNLPSKGGWRPVVGSGGIYYGPLGTAPLHSSYKVPLLDVYQSSMRPIATRDVTKLTSIAQSYRPTTLRTVPAQTAHPGHQPINSYLNPFALPSNGVTHYKFVQNYQPAESVLIRNQHNPYAARPMQKHPSKQKPQYHNNILQQLTNVQQIQFGQYSTGKPLDLFAAPIDYKREKRPNSAETEIYKPEVYKISESESSPQFVKTAQQQGGQKIAQNPYAQYSFHDLANFHQFPPSILGTFGSFGVQSVKGRDPLHQVTKNSFLQAQPTKHTIFNSFGYTPTFKTTPAIFSSTTPKLQTVPNHLLFGSGFGNFATQQTKLDVPLKIDPNAGIKNSFKPSPYDAFTIKNAYNFDINKVTTYNPPLIQSTTPLYFNDYGAQVNGLLQNYNNQKNTNYNNINNKKQQSDSVGLTQQLSQQYVDAPDALNLQNNQFNQLYHPYEVVENEPEELKTQSPWTVTPEQNQDSDTKQDEADNNIDEKLTTPGVDQKEEFAIITGNEKDFNNGFNYNQAESQSRRPLGDDFEPIGKQKLKDYYYRVSTPAYNSNNKPVRRTKKPNESVKPVQEITTEVITYADNTDASSAPLPTLPPNLHFKRPNSNDTTIDKDKIRKRNKIRRRRPQLANINRNKTENATQNETSTEPPTTVADEIHTIRPRPRTTKTSVTTQTITTDLTTSALPTTAPTRPTVIKKKLVGHRRPFTTTTTEKYEATTTTTTSTAKEHDYSRESPIMKISTRPHHQKTTASYDFKINETPDYSHKQDEKDTPTSDVSVSLTDTLKTSSDIKEFSFHRDARPVEMKETTESLKDTNDAETSQNEDTSPRSKLRPRLKNKFDRPKFSMKDYRSRLNSTTTTEKSTENTPKPRVSIRKPPSVENYFTEVETTTERKKFTPKEPRHKLNRTDNNEPEIHSRQVNRQNKPNAEEQDTTPPQKISARIRSGQRRPRPTEETTESTSPTTLLLSKRPLRKKVYDSDVGESVNDIVTENTHDHKDYTSERTRSESAIMKIADKKHHDHAERIFEQSKRVSDLTLAASKDYNTPGMFKTVASNSRRIPSYFTIATDDPILPIEAFFPQLNQKKEA